MKLFCLILATIILTSCAKNEIDQQTESLIFPIGSSSFESNSYKVIVKDSVYTPKVIIDSNNGYWLEFSRNDLAKYQTVNIQFTRKKQDLVLFSETSNDFSRWLSPSYYIDSDNDKIKEKAIELTQYHKTNIEKAKIIQRFVIGYVKVNLDLSYSFYHKASTTFDFREGTCMNFSRLFVALCRAANIPARTVWGVIYPSYHHQWAQILDGDNNWRVLDLTHTKTFDLNDIEYLDLIYAPEENNLVRDRHLKEIMIVSLKYYNDYPAVWNSLNFYYVSNNKPDSLTNKYVYEYKKLHFHQ